MEAALDKGHKHILAKGAPCKSMEAALDTAHKSALAKGVKQPLIQRINQSLQKEFLAKGWKQLLAKGVTLKKDTLAKGLRPLEKGSAPRP